ncbi:hypothetical protein F5Y13DRAFT_152949 [Hypoxylon sp. FL1857]|nr:hypothetical protein F5Y13DRAFT_152949 [Hypoxylon sp. FL1857]
MTAIGLLLRRRGLLLALSQFPPKHYAFGVSRDASLTLSTWSPRACLGLDHLLSTSELSGSRLGTIGWIRLFHPTN